jgi:3-(3-hydroxy-phenyl)propionate hydroxylase
VRAAAGRGQADRAARQQQGGCRRPTGRPRRLTITTPEGPYKLEADWLIACDGASSPTAQDAGSRFRRPRVRGQFPDRRCGDGGRFPTERWFWFDPPFNRGQSALLHKQPDGVWRIDFQIGWDIDRKEELKPEKTSTAA